MQRLTVICALALLLMAGHNLALGQTRSTEVDLLKKEIDLLKRELDLLKRENDLLKAENAALKKGGSTAKTAEEPPAANKVTVGNVDYVYQGSVRNGNVVTVIVLATSQDGNTMAPNGSMTIIDDQGNKYTGRPAQGLTAPAMLREGIPVKLMWNFGGMAAFGGAFPPAPSAKITRFAGVIIQPNIGNNSDNTIDFRNVPAVIAKSKTK